MSLAPIALFTYKRARHTRETIEALQRNTLAKESDLIIFSDGSRSESDKEHVESVRKYVRSVSGFKHVEIIENESNLGLANSIIRGVTDVTRTYGKVIVLEDDMVTSPFFLQFMNDGLEFYKNEQEVISIHGYLYPLEEELPESFFLRGADCWGWATWKRGWDVFESDGRKLLQDLRKRGLEREFDMNGSHAYTRMLKWQARGALDSWAIRWHASAFLAGKMTLFPGRSLVSNIGLDASGTHCSTTGRFNVALSGKRVTIDRIPIEEHSGARQAVENYYRATQPSLFESALAGLKRMLRIRSS